MKRLLFLGVPLMLGVLLALVSGCDSDKDSTGPTNKATGDPEDPIFQTADSVFEGCNEITEGILFSVVEYTDMVFSFDTSQSSPKQGFYPGTCLGVTADSFLYVYHANSQYWYFYFGYWDTTTSETLSITMEDSMQFLHGSTPVQWPDSALLTGVKAGQSINISSVGEGSASANQNVTITGDIPGMGDIVLTGYGQVNVDVSCDDPQGSCDASLDMTHTISNLQLNLTDVMQDGCPTAGTIRHSGSISIECTGDTSLTFSDSWIVTQTYSSDIITTVFENSTTKWTVTGTCEGSGWGSSPRWGWLVE